MQNLTIRPYHTCDSLVIECDACQKAMVLPLPMGAKDFTTLMWRWRDAHRPQCLGNVMDITEDTEAET